MAHQRLHFKDDIAVEHTRGRQIRVSMALLGTLAGGVLLINSGIARLVYGGESFNAEVLAMAGAILLGAPIVFHAIKSLIERHYTMDELVALAVIAAFATQNYVTAGVVAFFML